jgi:glycosyltransferase involved in cell wall biosynthesis
MRGEPSIHLTGDVRDPYCYYAIGDVLVHPSFREGFPNAVLEGAAMELPAITTNALGCIDSVVDGETGIIVQKDDPDALHDAMLKLVEDAPLRKKMGQAARKRVLKDFDPAVLAQQVFEFITGENSK